MLLFNLDGRRLALELDVVDGVMESPAVYFMPSARPPVMGAVSYRGEAVCVVDLKALVGAAGRPAAPPYRIVIVKDGERALGLCARGEEIALLWEERGSRELSISPARGEYSSGLVEHDGVSYEVLDFKGIYEDVLTLLSPGP